MGTGGGCDDIQLHEDDAAASCSKTAEDYFGGYVVRKLECLRSVLLESLESPRSFY